MRVTSEDHGQELAMASTNVDHSRKGPKIIGLGDCLVAALACRNHRSLEEGRLLGVLGKPIEAGAPEDLVERRHPGPNGVSELLEGKIGLAVDHTDELPRSWSIRT